MIHRGQVWALRESSSQRCAFSARLNKGKISTTQPRTEEQLEFLWVFLPALFEAEDGLPLAGLYADPEGGRSGLRQGI